jgi:hypothetical protein
MTTENSGPRKVDTEEQHSSVPWSYRARLERTVLVPAVSGETKPSTEKMTVTGQVHPHPYNVGPAHGVVMGRLAGILGDGWRIVDLRISAWGENG